jgi:hypothetical protein
MNVTETRELLAYITKASPSTRFQPGAEEVWAQALARYQPRTVLDAVKRLVERQTWISLADVVGETRTVLDERKWSGQTEVSDGHCGRAGCRCTHDGDCYKGWLAPPFVHRPGPISPCGTCRTDLADALATIPAPGNRNTHDHARLHGRTKRKDRA